MLNLYSAACQWHLIKTEKKVTKKKNPHQDKSQWNCNGNKKTLKGAMGKVRLSAKIDN